MMSVLKLPSLFILKYHMEIKMADYYSLSAFVINATPVQSAVLL